MNFIVDYLMALSEVSNFGHRIGVANFGGTLGQVIALRPLRDGSIRDAIRPEKIEFTDFRPPLELAIKEFRESSSATSRSKAVILFTDGSPQISEKELSTLEKKSYFMGENIAGDRDPIKFPALIEELSNMGVNLFVVAVGDAKKDARLWKDLLGDGHYRSISGTSSLAKIYNEFLSDLLDFHTLFSRKLRDGQEIDVTLQPYLEKVTFSFVKEHPNVAIEVLPPRITNFHSDKNVLKTQLHEIYTILEPGWSYAWRIRVKNGSAWLGINQWLPTLSFSIKNTSLTIGDSLLVNAKLIRNDNMVVDEDLQLFAKISPPTGQIRTQQLESNKQGDYNLTIYDHSAVGKYSISVNAKMHDKPVMTRSDSTSFEVSPVQSSLWRQLTFSLIVVILSLIAIFINFQFRKREEVHSIIDKLSYERKQRQQLQKKIDSLLPKISQLDEKNEDLETSNAALIGELESIRKAGYGLPADIESNIESLTSATQASSERNIPEILHKRIDYNLNQATKLGDKASHLVSDSFFTELSKLKNPAKQWKLIHNEVSCRDANLPVFNKGVAKVLLNRWAVKHPDLMVDEFYKLLSLPVGVPLMKELANFAKHSNFGNKKGIRAKQLEKIANSTYQLGLREGSII